MRLSVLLACIVPAALAPVAAADIVLSDTEFATANWGVESVNIGGGGTTTVSQVLNTGNPGALRRVDMTPGPATGDAIYTLHRYGTTMATRYDPTTQGAIQSLDFSIDFREAPAADASTEQKVFFGAKQGTIVFAGPGIQEFLNSSFLPVSFSGLTASDFSAVGASGSFDLSAAGAPIRFGFITYVANSTGAFASRSDYDNFSVTIHQAPAPSSMLIAGLAGTLALRRRRK